MGFMNFVKFLVFCIHGTSIMVLSHLDDLASVCRRVKISLKRWPMLKYRHFFNFWSIHNVFTTSWTYT